MPQSIPVLLVELAALCGALLLLEARRRLTPAAIAILGTALCVLFAVVVVRAAEVLVVRADAWMHPAKGLDLWGWHRC